MLKTIFSNVASRRIPGFASPSKTLEKGKKLTSLPWVIVLVFMLGFSLAPLDYARADCFYPGQIVPTSPGATTYCPWPSGMPDNCPNRWSISCGGGGTPATLLGLWIMSGSPTVENVTQTSAKFVGKVSVQDYPVIEWGFCWKLATAASYQCAAAATQEIMYAGTQQYRITGTPTGALLPGTGYDFYVYATDAKGRDTASSYFTTLPNPSAPTVTDPTATDIGTSTVTLGANVTSLGYPASVFERGTFLDRDIFTALSLEPALGNTVTGAFSHIRTGLTPGTTYRYRGYASNSTGAGQSGEATFTTLTLPDLIASNGPLAGLVAETPTLFIAGIENTGGSDAIETFDTIFRFSTNASTADLGVFPGVSVDGLPAGESGPVPIATRWAPPYATTASKQLYVSVCVDNNTTWVSKVTESNEGNNCSPWAALSVSPALKPDLVTLSPNPGIGLVGTPLEFSAIIKNAGTADVPTSVTFPTVFQFDFNEVHDDGNEGTPFSGTSITGLTAPSGQKTTTYTWASPVLGTRWIRACADIGTGGSKVSELDDDNNCSPWSSVVISAPDLTASTITPTRGIVNEEIILTSTIRNIGTAPAGKSSQSLFQIGTILGSANTLSGVFIDTPDIDAGGSEVVRYPWTPTEVGTYYVRACADKASGNWAGVIVEDNANNCNQPTPADNEGWSTIVITEPPLSCPASCDPGYVRNANDGGTCVLIKCPAGTVWDGGKGRCE